MIALIKRILGRAGGGTGWDNEKTEAVKAMLLAELGTVRVDGKPVTHRRLESLMMIAGTNKRQTKKLLREIGARPSKRRGAKFWTLKKSGN